MIALWTCLGIFGGYVLTSVVFLRFPAILHKKKKQRFKCKHISHRGGAGECLENTIGAFNNALANGTDMFEIDVQLSADGEVVVSHDNHLDRVTGDDLHISDLHFDNLPLLKETLGVTFTVQETTSCTNGDRRIPKLRTLFEKYPNVPMNIDIKTKSPLLVDKVLDLLYEFNRKDLVVLGSFSSYPANLVHKKDPDINLCCSGPRIFLIYILFYIGLLPFVPLKESFFEIPLISVLLRHPNFNGCIFKVISWLSASPLLFRHLQRRGFQVYLFVINEPEDFHTCFKRFNVDGVMTDYPTKLNNYLKEQITDSTTTEEEIPVAKKD